MTTPQQQADELLSIYQQHRGTKMTDTGEPSGLIEFAEDSVARRVNGIINDLDELCRMAANDETADLIANEKIAVGQIVTRAKLIAAFLMARKPAPSHIRRVS